MAAEFYRKSTALYEEFKRRELHYLNIERSINSNYSIKNEINPHLEEYLEKINKREKESEKSCKDLLKHLEEMDKRTDQMCLNLTKLNVLRNAAISSNAPTWSSMNPTFDQTLNKPYYESAFLPNTSTASFYPTINERTLQVNPIFSYPSSKPDSHSQSTQTEHIFCDQCHYPFTRGSNGSNVNTAKGSVKLNETLYMESMANVSSLKNPNQDIYKDVVRTMDPNEILNLQSISKETLLSPSKTSMPFKKFGDNLVTETNNVNEALTQNLNSRFVEDFLVFKDISVSRNAGVTSESKEIATQKKDVSDQIDGNIPKDQFQVEPVNDFVARDIAEETSVTAEDKNSKMFEAVVSKSDDESINHEFDFLESDRRSSVKNKTIEVERRVSNTKSDNMLDNLKHETSCESVIENNTVETNAKANIDMKFQSNEVTDTGIGKNLKNPGSLLTPSDAKIDSSLSEGSPSPAHHSADISNHSESDSFSEKETPFAASAAYQALLGNVAAPKTVQKAPSPSDSDSEDEIEHVLSSAVRRTSNINFDALTQVQKKEEKKSSIPEVNPKIDKKASKPASTGISQSKLSKSTRKVLGLETSSGSEVELEVKQNTSKMIEEDSDEFDFYN